MNIYIAKNDQKLGPYSADEIRNRISTGEFSEADPGWHDGLPNWQPLSQIVAGLPSGPRALPSSILATISFAISMLGIPAWLFLLIMAARGVAEGESETSPMMITIGLLLFAGIGANIVGLILGIIPLMKSVSNKWMAIVGVIVNGLELVGVVLLMIIGMSQG